MTVHKLNLFADYFQFLIFDADSEYDSLDWSSEAVERMLAGGTDCVAIGTLRNVTVPVEIHILDAEPQVDLALYDNVAVGSVSIPSGHLIVMGCTDYLPDALKVQVPAGNYQVLSLAQGIETIKTEWDPADEVYVVYLWPGPERKPRLVKSWRSAVA